MKKYSYILSILLIACGHNNTKTEIKAQEEIIVTKTLETSFEDNVSEYGILHLETTDESCISEINKIAIFEDRIYILDNNNGGRLLMFDKQGKFIKTISGKGEAANEYLSLNNFQIDYSNKELLLLDDDSGKILIFSIDGEYKNHIKLQSKPSNILRLKNGNIILAHDICRLNTNENYALAICSPNGDILSRHIKNDVFLPFGFMSLNTLSESVDGNITFMPQFNNMVYSISQQQEVNPEWSVRFNSDLLSILDIDESKITDPFKFLEFKKNKNYMTGDHVENGNLLCMYNKGLSDLELIIYNKISKKTKRIRNPLLGYNLTADEDGYFWGVVSQLHLGASNTQSALTSELKKFIDTDENFPIVYYKLK